MTLIPAHHRYSYYQLTAYHGQAHADEALAWTAKLQGDLSAEVTVLNVCENGQSCPRGIDSKAIKARLKQSSLGAHRFLSRQGRPSSVIADIAETSGVDLIVLGHYRHGTLVEWFVGSTVDRLLRKTSLPVFIA